MRALAFVVTLGLSFTSLSACGGSVATVCDFECECEHCNDIAEDFKCAGRQAELDVADAYGCADQWEEWAGCYEDRGVCDAESVSFSTREQGSCSGTLDTGTTCMTAADCGGGLDGATCTSGTCRIRTCAGNNNQPCQTNSECGSGADRREAEAKRLYDCQAASSADPRLFGGDTNPQPGGTGN